MSHDVSKLPKWAQRRIDVLEQSLSTAYVRLRERDEGDTNILVDPYSPGQSFHLDDRVLIHFYTPGPKAGRRYIGVRWTEDGWLQVNSDHHRIIIAPHAANLISVRLDR
jgi:hypothetical protein